MEKIDANEAVANANGTLVLQGQTFLLEPLNDQIFGTVTSFIRRRMKAPLESIMHSLKDLPPELAKEAVREATRLQAGGKSLEFSKEYLDDQMHDPKVLGFFVWTVARKAHPDVKVEQFEALVAAEGCEKVLADLYEGLGLDKVSKEKN